MHIEELLDEEVTALAGERDARKAPSVGGRRHGSNLGPVGLAGQRVPLRLRAGRGEIFRAGGRPAVVRPGTRPQDRLSVPGWPQGCRRSCSARCERPAGAGVGRRHRASGGGNSGHVWSPVCLVQYKYHVSRAPPTPARPKAAYIWNRSAAFARTLAPAGGSDVFPP